MKRLLLTVTFFVLSICGVMAQNDTMYVMKDGIVINKQSIKSSDVDSIIFYNPVPTSVIDIEGNVYKIVTIGNQVWMAENLKVTKYNDGTEIPLETDNTAWSNLSSPGYCYYDNSLTNKETYGALYNWYAVSSSTNGGKNVCPVGWHVPSDSEWTTLTNYIGGTSQGNKLKSTSGWINFDTKKPEGNGTDDYGFSGIPSGIRSYDLGYFALIGSYGYWWSSTFNTTNTAWYHRLNSNNSDVDRIDGFNSYGMSIRCIQD